jgi:hypothetical protein
MFNDTFKSMGQALGMLGATIFKPLYSPFRKLAIIFKNYLL